MAGQVKRYVIVSKSTGYIENVILWDGNSGWTPPEGSDVILEHAAIKQGLEWTPVPPPPPVPDKPEKK